MPAAQGISVDCPAELPGDRKLEPAGSQLRQQMPGLLLSPGIGVGAGDVQDRLNHVSQVEAAALAILQPIHVFTSAMQGARQIARSGVCASRC